MKEKIKRIVDHYGIDVQLKYLQSEVFELNEAVIRQRSNPLSFISMASSRLSGKMNTYTKNIAGEIADVMVMLEQIRLYYDIPTSEIKNIMEYKVDRQIKRIENNKE